MARVDLKIICLLICILVVVSYFADAEPSSRRRSNSRRRTISTRRRSLSRRRRSSSGAVVGGSTRTGTIAGAVFGTLIGIAVLIAAFICCRKHFCRTNPNTISNNASAHYLHTNQAHENSGSGSNESAPEVDFKGRDLGSREGAPPDYNAVTGNHPYLPPYDASAAAYPPQNTNTPYPPLEPSAGLPYPPQGATASPYPPADNSAPFLHPIQSDSGAQGLPPPPTYEDSQKKLE